MTPPSQFRIVIFLLVCHPKKTKTLPPNSIFPRVLLRVLWVVVFFGGVPNQQENGWIYDILCF